MRILYGIQGTGNGHLSRAMEMIPHLQKRGEVDLLISGHHSELKLKYEIKYQCHGLGFVFGKKGGIDLIETYRKSHLKKFYQEVNELDLKPYDLLISDFEPVTAWASLRQHKVCVGLSNQASLLFDEVPKSKKDDFVGKFILKNYAPTSLSFGFSYKNYHPRVYTPLIRQSLRDRNITDEGHYTVYLPSFSDKKILKFLSTAEGAKWHVFSKYADAYFEEGNIKVFPLNKERFEQSITSSRGIVTAAGFGTTTEALYMGKKLLVVPQKNQYEQACNAEALKDIGIRVIKSLKSKHAEKLQYWVNHGVPVQMDYPDLASHLIDEMIFASHQHEDAYTDYIERAQYELKRA